MTLDDDNCNIYDVNDKFNDSQELSFSYSINDIIKIIKLEKQKKLIEEIIFDREKNNCKLNEESKIFEEINFYNKNIVTEEKTDKKNVQIQQQNSRIVQ